MLNENVKPSEMFHSKVQTQYFISGNGARSRVPDEDLLTWILELVHGPYFDETFEIVRDL
jgi:hypothetical protein